MNLINFHAIKKKPIIDPYQIIADLNEKLKKAEKLIMYYDIDSRMHYREDKKAIIHSYNFKHGTKYKFISEFIEKMNEQRMSPKRIADILQMTRAAILVILKKMNAKTRGRGGANNVIFLHPNTIKDIRTSNEKYYALAKKYNISSPTVSRIRRKVGRWADF